MLSTYFRLRIYSHAIIVAKFRQVDWPKRCAMRFGCITPRFAVARWRTSGGVGHEAPTRRRFCDNRRERLISLARHRRGAARFCAEAPPSIGCKTAAPHSYRLVSLGPWCHVSLCFGYDIDAHASEASRAAALYRARAARR